MYEYGTWVVTSKHFDDVILPELKDLASKMETAREHANKSSKAPFIPPSKMLPEHVDTSSYQDFSEMPIKLEIQDLLKKIREQEEFIPFNHKAERINFELYKCSYKTKMFMKTDKIECNLKETLYLHDGQLVVDSAV